MAEQHIEEIKQEKHYQSPIFMAERVKKPSLLRNRIVGNKMLLVGAIIVFVFFVMAAFGPVLTVYDPLKMNFKSRFLPPSKGHWMGTDQYGRDIYSRILYGARLSLKVGFFSVLVAMTSGIIIGALAGMAEGFVDHALMRMMDALLAFPSILLALGLVASMGPGLRTICISIGVIFIPRFARVMRSSVLAEREKEYVEAARAIGQSNSNILIKHIGPSCISPVIVLATIVFALSIIIEAALSFLGVGMPPPTPSLGAMLDEARRYLHTSVWMGLFPGVSISVVVLGFNLLGDGLRDFLDPRFYNVGKSATE